MPSSPSKNLSAGHARKKASSTFLAVRAVIIGAICTLVLMLICAKLMESAGLPLRFAIPMATCCSALGVLATAYFLEIGIGCSWLLCGLLSGLLYALSGLCAALLLGAQEFTMLAGLKLICLLLSGLLGSYWAKSRRQAKRPRTPRG